MTITVTQIHRPCPASRIRPPKPMRCPYCSATRMTWEGMQDHLFNRHRPIVLMFREPI